MFNLLFVLHLQSFHQTGGTVISFPWIMSSEDFYGRITYLRLLIWDLGQKVKARAILKSPKSRKLTVKFLVKLVQLKIIGNVP